ncbi:MAG: hypothetical protein HeimC3_15110 [Candidatus Heimdallarchaeota archaeon LC_3]|nr:MAG: hypothetical protein HeimC3_15110 [Candidatus Heimdallarchaeota archaeon LC_3]
MSTTDQNIDDNQKKVIEVIINHYHDKIRASIEQNLNTSFGSISKQNIVGFLKHQGAGGTTFVLTADFYSSTNNKVRGGIVVKFANELDLDVRNALELNKLLKKRQIEWNKNISTNISSKMPSFVFSPLVLGTHPKQNVLVLEFINGGVPLLHSDFSESTKNQILGYALARLHGSEAYPTDMRLYEPVFNVLETFFPDENGRNVLNQWKEWLSNSNGGVEYIHGDSHLDNIMYSEVSKSLAWIDALLIPNGERFDDLTYAMSHIIQERLIFLVESNPNESSRKILNMVLGEVASTIVPQMLTTYMRTANISGLYKDVIPLDFFLGLHLIVRSQMFANTVVEKILVTIGKELILERPLVKMLGLEKE